MRALALVVFAAGPFLVMAAEDPPAARFGATVVLPSGLRGVVYHIKHNTTRLPDLSQLKPKGTIYTPFLYVLPQDFQAGFPGGDEAI